MKLSKKKYVEKNPGEKVEIKNDWKSMEKCNLCRTLGPFVRKESENPKNMATVWAALANNIMQTQRTLSLVLCNKNAVLTKRFQFQKIRKVFWTDKNVSSVF